MILSPRNTRRVGLAAFALPIIIAAAVRIVAPAALPGPSVANADGEGDRHIRTHTLAPPTDVEIAGARRIVEHNAATELTNRLAYPESSVQYQTPTTDPASDDVPEFTVTSIVEGRIGRVALINGKLRREGDEAAPNWTVMLIDEGAREVTLAGPDDQTVVVKLRRRSSR